MTDGTELQELEELTEESKDLSEARQDPDRAALEPEAAAERSGTRRMIQQIPVTVPAHS